MFTQSCIYRFKIVKFGLRSHDGRYLNQFMKTINCLSSLETTCIQHLGREKINCIEFEKKYLFNVFAYFFRNSTQMDMFFIYIFLQERHKLITLFLFSIHIYFLFYFSSKTYLQSVNSNFYKGIDGLDRKC